MDNIIVISITGVSSASIASKSILPRLSLCWDVQFMRLSMATSEADSAQELIPGT